MNIDAEILALLFVVTLLVFLIISISLIITKGIQKSAGSMTNIVFGATDELLNKDQKKAAEVIVEKNANKKLEEQTNSAPKSPAPND